MPRRLVRLVVVVAVVAGACTGDDGNVADTTSPTTDDPVPVTSTETAVSTTVPTFTGDADSPFCDLIDEGQERPVLDPFEAGLEPGEVELRLRNLRNRFSDFADVSPPELRADLDALVVALADTDESLAVYDHDLVAMAEAGYTVSTFDDPVFSVVAFRLGQYRAQVCEN